jgi:NADP-dependent 3-hydroxy acid dehydrogenase YdfG
VGSNIRTTIISPGAVSTELTQSITDLDLKPGIDEIYKGALEPESIARAMSFAIEHRWM